MKREQKYYVPELNEIERKTKNFFILVLIFLLFDSNIIYADSEYQEGKSESMLNINYLGLIINAKFDVSLESRNFNFNPLEGKYSLVNYHHFLFISRRTTEDNFFFSAEVIERVFYEFGVRFPRFSVKFGRVLVPFGADPLFHHNYGGLTGFDQKFVPFIWSELGGVFNSHILRTEKILLSNDFYVVNGPSGDPEKIMTISAGSPSNFAVGDRIKLGYSLLTAYASTYWVRYAPHYDLFMWGADFVGAYGFIPFFKNLSLKLGFAYMNVVGNRQTVGNYYHYANYLRIDYKLPFNLFFRFIVGAKTFQNYSYPFYDTKTKDENDEFAFNFALMYRRGIFLSQIQYVKKLEGKEIKDDFMRILFSVEF
ncbi:hypothetical protein HRbin19_00863 [bacterium HR19]|nr:hypothetical protein HRbin19_00863 [bacterium HR19]